MEIQVSDPRTDPDGLSCLAPLWEELHRHHLEVSTHRHLVEDLRTSWKRRERLYRRLLAQGGSYVTAADNEGRLVGYAMVAVEDAPDDTFEVKGGTTEVVTLVVTRDQRSAGVGRALLVAAEGIARDHGFDTVKIAVMSGNARAQDFYEAHGYSIAEQVLYRHLGDQ
jgi:ribosomal protein S18 acetylase RimI-like enzyme